MMNLTEGIVKVEQGHHDISGVPFRIQEDVR